MQPYFLPYIGYWQLLHVVDKFVIFDDVQFKKRGWVNRNYILINSKKFLITIPIKKHRQKAKICDINLAKNIRSKTKLLKSIKMAYCNAPFFEKTFPLIKSIIENDDENLFSFIDFSLKLISQYLGINSSKIIISSSLKISKNLKGEERIISICKKLKANSYYNPIGGLDLYNKKAFRMNGIKLCFLRPNKVRYEQYDNSFVSNLSILDVIMFNSIPRIKNMLNDYQLV
tara:strand:- start:719 stop:1405 length:687 start_codon:yes stop_codon:yes gene_type:complete